MATSKTRSLLRQAAALPVRSARGAVAALLLAAPLSLALSESASGQTETMPVVLLGDDVTVDEGQVAEVEVRLENALSSDLTVNYALGAAPETGIPSADAAESEDFTDLTGTSVTFPAGTTGPQLIRVQTNQDGDTDNEMFEVALFVNPLVGAVFGNSGRRNAIVTITDDDTSTPAPPPPSTPTFSISPTTMTVPEGGEITFDVTLEGADITEGTDVVFVVEGTGTHQAAEEDYTVFGRDPSGPQGNLDRELPLEAERFVTFPPTSTVSTTRPIRVEMSQDTMPEEAETFTVRLTGTVSGAASARREARMAGNLATDMLGTATATVTIMDDDGTVSISDASADEGDDVTFTVTLAAFPRENVEVDYATSIETGDTAEAGDFTSTSGSLIFRPGEERTMTIKVPTSKDDDIDSETFTVTLSETTAGFPAGVTLDRATAQGTIGEASARLGRANSALLPHVAQAIVSSTLSAITGRIASADSGGPPQASSLSGGAGPLRALASNARALEDGTLGLEQALGGSSFALSLDAAEGGGIGALTVWGNGDYRRLSGPDDSKIDWDGDMFGFHVSADMRVQRDLLAGLSVSRYVGAFDYTDRTDPRVQEGSYDTHMNSVHPYISWSPSGGASLWATVGYGQGEVEIRETGRDRHQSDTEMRMAAVGASLELLSGDGLLAGGRTTLRLKGDGSVAGIDVEGEGEILPEDFDVRHLRVSLEGAHECTPGSSGGCLSPSVEVGVRHDGGDARTGLGVELGGGLRYTDPASGLTLEGRGHVLVADRDDHEDWGAAGLILLDPGMDGMGLSLRLAPSFGDAPGGSDRLYEQGAALLADADADAAPAGRLDAEIGYGFSSLHGVVTPYTRLSLADGGTRSYRVGNRFRAGPSLSVSLEGERRESGAEAPDHGVMLRGQMHW